MNYHNISSCDIVNGEGVRCVVWVSGCPHECDGCFNPSTWNPKSGIKFDSNAEQEILKALESPYCNGLTLSGGDPFHITNLGTMISFCTKVKEQFPTKTIWAYSGFEFEFLAKIESKRKLLTLCDVLVDGKFKRELHKPSLKHRGSSNQRIIMVQESLAQDTIVYHKDMEEQYR